MHISLSLYPPPLLLQRGAGRFHWHRREEKLVGAMERKVLLVCTVVGFLGILSAVLGFAAEATKAKVIVVLGAGMGEGDGLDSASLLLSISEMERQWLLLFHLNSFRLPSLLDCYLNVCFHRRTLEFCGSLVCCLGLILDDADVKKIGPAGCIHPRTPAFALGLAAVLALTIAQAIINTVAGCICCKRHHYSSSTNCAIALVSLIISWVTFTFAFLLLLLSAALGDHRGRQWLHIDDQCSFLTSGVFSGGAVLSLATVSFGIIYYIKTVEPREAQQNQGIAMGQPQIPQQSTQPVLVHEDTYHREQFP